MSYKTAVGVILDRKRNPLPITQALCKYEAYRASSQAINLHCVRAGLYRRLGIKSEMISFTI